mmetsp:Transcript_62139/g.148206  ORF Transcript_62139/g.148206 Transcript_62139/m.148206 type:complete len:339 (-) Transcript_62139:195-1211(-)
MMLGIPGLLSLCWGSSFVLSAGGAADSDDIQDSSGLQQQQACNDQDWQCKYWAAIGECDKNPRYMHVMCKFSCRLCPSDSHVDDTWRYAALENHFVPQRLPPLATADFNAEEAWKASRSTAWFTERLFEPRVYALDEFLSDADCGALIAEASSALQLDAAPASSGSQEAVLDPAAKGGQLSSKVAEVVQRLSTFARFPASHAEPLLVVKRSPGEFRQPVHESQPGRGRARAAAVILFLSEAADGGEVLLPRLAAACYGENFLQCCTTSGSPPPPDPPLGGKLALRPVGRQAVLLYTHDLDGRRNSLGKLGFCPPVGEEVWMAVQWFHIQPYNASNTTD